ncbi:uncharacterized protein LOC141690650 [Apium graveolens]|uniref:uncharacterized protein LOC141690650 n=1 Tax=Apium graveolens TaxID=4045 RepID=UPI003D7AC187
MSQEDGDEHWCLPKINTIKVNFDAAIFEKSGCNSFAFIARDHEGGLVEARSKCQRGSPKPERVKAIGIHGAPSWVKNKDLCDDVIESDCLQIVQAIRSSIKCFSNVGSVINECRVLLASFKYKNIMFRFVKRSANKVAH